MEIPQNHMLCLIILYIFILYSYPASYFYGLFKFYRLLLASVEDTSGFQIL